MPSPTEQMPPEADVAPEQGGGDPGGAAQLVTDIHEDMVKLMDMVQKAKLPEQDVQQLGALIQGFQSFVTETLGASQDGAPPQANQGAMGQSPMEAGGNPNARPMA